MASNTADNFLQLPHNGVYGNKSVAVGSYADLSKASSGALAAGDTLDLVKLPAGATYVSGFLFSTQMTGTSTLAIGVRAADGTSTGGTTGTAVLVSGTASGVTGLGQTNLRFAPFTNDFDTIVYATFVSGPVPAASDNIALVLDYVANNTR